MLLCIKHIYIFEIQKNKSGPNFAEPVLMCRMCVIYLAWLTIPLRISSQCRSFINFLREKSERTPFKEHSNPTVWLVISLSASSSSLKTWFKKKTTQYLYDRALRLAHINLWHNDEDVFPKAQKRSTSKNSKITVKESLKCSHLCMHGANEVAESVWIQVCCSAPSDWNVSGFHCRCDHQLSQCLHAGILKCLNGETKTDAH